MTTNDTSSRKQETFINEESLKQFNIAIDCLGDENAIGKAYAIYRENNDLQMHSLDQESLLVLSKAGAINSMKLNDCEYILIDSGNSSGDAWKGFFFPKERLFIHLQEN